MRVKKSDHRRGAATVEFAFLLPFLMFLAVIATDWARLFYYTITIEACARNGAIYASDEEVQAKSPYANVTQAALAEAPQLNSAATVTQTNNVSTNTVTVKVETEFKTITNFPGVPKSQTLSRSVQMKVAPLLTKAP